MSTIIILAPVIISSWPAIAATVGVAAASLGLVANEVANEGKNKVEQEQSIELDISGNTTISETLSEDQKLEFVSNEGIKITVKCDERGRCSVCATGKGFSDSKLKERAEQFVEKLTQCYVYNKVVNELKNKKFQIVDQKVGDDESIKINVRRWVD